MLLVEQRADPWTDEVEVAHPSQVVFCLELYVPKCGRRRMIYIKVRCGIWTWGMVKFSEAETMQGSRSRQELSDEEEAR